MLPFAYVRGQNIEYEIDDDNTINSPADSSFGDTDSRVSGGMDDPDILVSRVTGDLDSRISGGTGDADIRVPIKVSSPLSQLESVLLAGEYIIPPRESGVGIRTILIGKYHQESYLFYICLFSFIFLCRCIN
jgi:hypothetical protein